MKRVTGFARLAALCLGITAGAAAAAGGAIVPYDFNADLDNTASLQRGAKLFMNYCSGCHSLKYLRYQRLVTDLGIPPEIVQDNLIFSEDIEISDHITTGLPSRSQAWFGVAPPDLTLAARHRGPDWIYSFLLAFYLDEKSPTGVNNLVYPNTAMPHVLAPLQGYQSLVHEEGAGHGAAPNFELVQKGALSPAEYQEVVADITNFLVYAGEPAKLVRYGLGFKVILFLIGFTILAWLLKREFWRDVH